MESTHGTLEPTGDVAEFTVVAFGGLCSVFALIGVVSSLYGPLLIAFSHRFAVSIPQAGEVLSVHFVGALLGVTGAWGGVRRTTGRHVLHASLAALALGALAATLAHNWDLFLAAVFVVGLGFGGLDFSLNTLLTRSAEVGRARRLSVANAGYGVGAVVGPLLVALLHPSRFTALFAGVATLSIALVLLTRGVSASRLRTSPSRRAQRRPDRRAILSVFVAAYVCYVAVETASSGWIATQLRHESYSTTVASLVTAGFWGGLALGRALGGPLHRHVGARALVLGGLVAAVLLVGAAEYRPFAPWTYGLTGLVLASVFPMGLLWYTELCPGDVDGIALMILTMMAGGVIGPGAESLAVTLGSVHVVPVVIVAFALADLAAFGLATRYRALPTVAPATLL